MAPGKDVVRDGHGLDEAPRGVAVEICRILDERVEDVVVAGGSPLVSIVPLLPSRVQRFETDHARRSSDGAVGHFLQDSGEPVSGCAHVGL